MSQKANPCNLLMVKSHLTLISFRLADEDDDCKTRWARLSNGRGSIWEIHPLHRGLTLGCLTVIMLLRYFHHYWQGGAFDVPLGSITMLSIQQQRCTALYWWSAWAVEMWTLESLYLLKTTDFRGPLSLHWLKILTSYSCTIFKPTKRNQVI